MSVFGKLLPENQEQYLRHSREKSVVIGFHGISLREARSACLAGDQFVEGSTALAPRSIVSASSAEATIRNRLTALSTGVAPSRMRPYIITVSGASEPTSISVVLKFSNDIRNEMAAAPISDGFRYGRVMVASTAVREAPRL